MLMNRNQASYERIPFQLMVLSTIGVVVFSFFDWLTYRGESISLYAMWDYTNTARRFMLMWSGQAQDEITFVLALLTALIALLAVSVILQVIALLKYHSGTDGQKFALNPKFPLKLAYTKSR